MTRRTRRPTFQRKLTDDAAKQHVQQMVEVRQYVTERSRGLYPLTPDHQAFTALNEAIDLHIAHWTNNLEFCYSGHLAGIWMEANNDNESGS